MFCALPKRIQTKRAKLDNNTDQLITVSSVTTATADEPVCRELGRLSRRTHTNVLVDVMMLVQC